MKKIWCILLLIMLLLPYAPFQAIAEGVMIIGQENDTMFSLGGETELKPNETVKVDGEYAISYIASAVHGPNKSNNGYYWVILKSKENGASVERFDFPVGTHTSGYIVFKLTNRSTQNVNWLKRVKCTVIFDDQYVFDTLATQTNPNQTASTGKTGYDSTVAVDIEPLEAVYISFFFSVPYLVRDSSKSLVAYVSIDEDMYAIDLRKTLQIDDI